MKLFIALITIFLLGLVHAEKTKSHCAGCTDAVNGFLKGLEDSKNKNFGGGDTAWEEKNNLKYKTSELRLTEILETACAKDNFRCHQILSDYEDEIEEWYKTMQDSDTPLQKFLCMDTAKVCCPEGKFGKKCTDCPQNSDGKICWGRGRCEGAGDKQGSGKCVCDKGYSGDLCNECGDGYLKTFSNDTYLLCVLCHANCETCTGPGADECSTCKAGFREEKSGEGDDAKMSCVDINECVEQSGICPVGKYCANTEGSYSCEDIDECASGAMCMGMYEVCVNTPGHYKCECARFFKRDETTGQCQPDPAIYSQYLPPSARRAGDEDDEGEVVEEDEFPSLGDDDGSSVSGETGGNDASQHHSCSGNSFLNEQGYCQARDPYLEEEPEPELSWEDKQRLAVAVVVCMIGTMAANGNIFWTLMFFASLAGCAVWWASDKTDKIASSIIKLKKKTEL